MNLSANYKSAPGNLIIMQINRKLAYATLLSGYYTFIIVFSLGASYTDILISTLLITVLSYIWIIRSAVHIGEIIFDYKDLVLNIFIYSFISFSIAFSILAFSPSPIDLLGIVVMLSPIILWVVIWSDFYLRRIKGLI